MATPATYRSPAPRRDAVRPAPRRETPPQPPPPLRPRPRDGKVWLGALVASAFVHLLLLLLYTRFGVDRAGVALTGPVAPRSAPQGIEVVQIVEMPGDLFQPEPPPLAPERAAPVPAAPRATDPQGPTVDTPEAPPAVVPGLPPVAERLRPGEVDERLWRIDADLAELSDRELARLLLTWTIEEMGDSALAAEARARAGTDWTYTTEDGKRWGLSQGRLHLGDISIPLPFFFSAPPGSDAARRASEDAEIVRGAAAAAARSNMQDRIRAIRERRDREREEAARARPDTTLTRR